MERKRVAIESFYAYGDVEKNVEFARNVSRWALERGYNPYAMHLFFTQFLDDTIAEERKTDIECGLGWTDLADEVWYCLRPDDELENSRGMKLSLDHNREHFPDRVLRFMIFTQTGKLLGHTSNEEVHPPFPIYSSHFAVAGRPVIERQIKILKALL